MNSQEARDILRRFRPGCPEADDPDVVAALAQARRDPELAGWLNRQQAFHACIRAKLQSIAPPAELREKILARQPPAPKVLWWRRPAYLALAAMVVFLCCLAAYWLKPLEPSRLESFRIRMTKEALRGYRMDLATHDMSQVRAYLAQHSPHGHFVLNPSLEKIPVLGCKLMRWQNQPVSLICFGQNKTDLLWYFIIYQSALAGETITHQPVLQSEGKLMTAIWTQGTHTYFLAVMGDEQALRKYL